MERKWDTKERRGDGKPGLLIPGRDLGERKREEKDHKERRQRDQVGRPGGGLEAEGPGGVRMSGSPRDLP